ncbi:triadin isoform X22 [Latimeria chalumnae]|uniref:triadin isoform X22 n=1 Tax=Latimeria chalumnae TaxID=7897 RepID=UPI00313F092D
MTEITAEGRAVASPTIIDSKNGAVPKPSVKAGKKTVTDDLMATFNSPAAWLLVFALIITWSAVAIVMFDLIDYKSYVATYSQHCDDPCLPPGIRQHGVGKTLKEATSPRGGISKLSTDPMKLIEEAVEESTDWFYGFVSLLSDMVSTDDDDDDDEDEIEPPLKKKGVIYPPSKKKAVLKEKSERQTKIGKKAPPKEEKKIKATRVQERMKKETKAAKAEKKAVKVKKEGTKAKELEKPKRRPRVKVEKPVKAEKKAEKKVSKAAVTRTPAKRKPTAKKPIVHPAEGKQAKPKPKPKEIKKVEAAAARRRKTSIVESVKPGKGKAKPAKPTAKPAAEKHTRPHTKELAKRKAPPPAVRKTKELKKPAAKSREVKPKQKAVLKVVKAKDSKPVKGKNLNYYLSEPEKKERPAPKVSAKIKPPKTRMVGSVGKLRTKAKAEKPKTAKPQWRKEKAIAAQAKKEQPVKKKEEQAKPTEKAKLSKVKAKPEKQKERKPIVVSKEKAKPARAPTAKPKVTKEEKKGKPELKAVTEGKQTKPETKTAKEEKQLKPARVTRDKTTRNVKGREPAPTVAAGRRAMATTKPAKVQVPKREPAKKERAAVSRSEKSSIVQKKHAREVIRKAPVINETTQYCNTGTGVSETSAFQNRGKAPVRFFQCVFMEGNNGRTSHLPSGHKADKNPSARKTRSPGH